MNFDNKKIIIGIALFIVCMIVAFGTTKILQTCENHVVLPADSTVIDSMSIDTKGTENDMTHKENVSTVLTDVRQKDDTKAKRPQVDPAKPQPKKSSETKDEPVLPPTPLMNNAEMKQMLMSGSDAGSEKLAPGFRIVVQGQKSDEKKVESAMDVHDKIKFGQWQNIYVFSMSFDDQGRVTVVHIKPEY